MSFAIIISEKGGQERREVFDKNEISIGRVQGNDLLLPKGNVSKRHARVVYRDGRFIVTDLKSTNGSYVNGHRIAQATIVREGDKIYIGDFILKVDGVGFSSSTGQHAPAREAEGHLVHESELSPPAREIEPAVLPHAPPKPFPPQEPSSQTQMPPDHEDEVAIMQSGSVAQAGPFNAEATRPPRAALSPSSHVATGVIPPRPAPTQVAQLTGPARSALTPAAPAFPSRPGVAARLRDSIPRQPGPTVTLAALLHRLADIIEESEADAVAPPTESRRHSVERVLREQVRAMQQEAELPTGVSPDDLVRAGMREALGLGPFAEPLEDPDVLEIHAIRFDHVVVVRESGPTHSVEFGFTSEHALRRAVARLAHAVGHAIQPSDTAIDLRLLNGVRLIGVFPPVAANGSQVLIRKRRHSELSLDDLVRNGTMSRAMSTFLQQCLQARTNVLVTGPFGAGTTSVVGALLAALPIEERTIVLQQTDELTLTQPLGTSLLLPDVGESGAKVLRTAAAMRPNRLVLDSLANALVGPLVEAIAAGQDGVVAAVRGPSLKQSLSRLVPALVAGRAGLDAVSAAMWIAASFHIVVEVGRLRADRHKVMRIAEVSGNEGGELRTRNVFDFGLNHAMPDLGEGAFRATGVVPGLVTELRARGLGVDETIFRPTR